MNNSSNLNQDDSKNKLTAKQHEILYGEGTEPPFQNEYWDNHAEGIYVDVVSGEALFSSKNKYDSGSGWPSFTEPISEDALKTTTDHSYNMVRTEVKGATSNIHHGHVFDDGPRDKGGKRYCMNSAGLRFIPKEKLEEEGYGKYLPLFT